MKKQYWILVLILIVLVFGYLGRHRIRTLLSGTPPPAQPVQTRTTTLSPSVPPAATASAGIITVQSNSTKGSFLVGSTGMTLYIFDKDKSGVSNCFDSCALLWPPYKMGSTSTLPANVSTLKRPDGSLQYAYKGMPLYYYVPDKKPGDVLGDGVGGVWHLVKP